MKTLLLKGLSSGSYILYLFIGVFLEGRLAVPDTEEKGKDEICPTPEEDICVEDVGASPHLFSFRKILSSCAKTSWKSSRFAARKRSSPSIPKIRSFRVYATSTINSFLRSSI